MLNSLYLGFYIKSAVSQKEAKMNPLDSIVGTIIAGVVLTVVFYYVARALVG